MLEGGGHVKYIYHGSLEVHDADENVGKNAEDFPILSNPSGTTLKWDLRRLGEIQHRYAIAPA